MRPFYQVTLSLTEEVQHQCYGYVESVRQNYYLLVLIDGRKVPTGKSIRRIDISAPIQNVDRVFVTLLTFKNPMYD